jgi:hypothetical protein
MILDPEQKANNFTLDDLAFNMTKNFTHTLIAFDEVQINGQIKSARIGIYSNLVNISANARLNTNGLGC